MHIHSIYSLDGTDTIRELLEQAAYHDNLDVIAITDHDEIRGSLEAVELAPGYGIDAIPGMEVTTLEGHILALFIEQNLPPRRPLIETLIRIGEMGGMVIIPHPNSPLANSLHNGDILRAATHPDASKVLVGLEVFTGCLVVNSHTAPLRGLAQQLRLCEISASDAHVKELVGSGLVRFTGLSAKDLKKALLQRQVTPIIRFNPSGTRVIASWTRQTLHRRRNIFDYLRQVSAFRAEQSRRNRRI
ncbi:MAG: PHP domain-containing protein [Anaerolineales bacterium]|nr:PHP domain-containing protein [Anaerolineales bacterium]